MFKTQNTVTPLYHTFQYKDDYFLHDVSSGYCLRIDKVAHEVLKLLKSKTRNQTLAELQHKFPHEEIETVLSELDHLHQFGLFKKHKPKTPEEVDRYITRLVNRSSPSLQLEVAQGCNMSCLYCYEDNKNASQDIKLMTRDIGEKAVEFLIRKSKNSKRINLTFFGGEPLLNWKLIKHLIHYVERRKKELNRETFYSMTTNGTLVTDEIARYIKKYNFGLMCSLDGPSEIQNKMRPMKNGAPSYDKATQGINRIMKIRSHVTVRATMNRVNNDINRLNEFFKDFGFTRFAIGSAIGKSYKKNNIDYNKSCIEMLIKQADQETEEELKRLKDGKKLYRNIFEVIRNIHNKQKINIRCGVGKGTTIVNCEGRLFPCHRYIGMNNYVIGDIHAGYDNARLYDYLLDYYNVKQHCQDCWLVNLCGGPCPWYVAHDDGKHRPPDKNFMCKIIQRTYERAIWLYITIKEEFPEYFNKLMAINN